MEEIIVTLITIGIPSAASIVTGCINHRLMNKHSAKQSILQLIMEDHMAVQEGRLPTNYQSVLLEYDIYHKNGGNSYITQRVEDYKIWFKQQEESRK